MQLGLAWPQEPRFDNERYLLSLITSGRMKKKEAATDLG